MRKRSLFIVGLAVLGLAAAGATYFDGRGDAAEGYFMWALVLGTESRPVPDGSPSDAEIAKAARLYNSAGGTYELIGSTLRYNRVVSIGPGRMLPENQPYVRQLVTLTSNRLETATTNTAGVTTTLKYTRVE